jgi:uncharacterized protein YecA (UPF0149 family)
MKGECMKTIKCLKCGVRLHPSDWIILKKMNTLPICDNCSLIDEENNIEAIKGVTNINKNSRTINKVNKERV